MMALWAWEVLSGRLKSAWKSLMKSAWKSWIGRLAPHGRRRWRERGRWREMPL